MEVVVPTAVLLVLVVQAVEVRVLAQTLVLLVQRTLVAEAVVEAVVGVLVLTAVQAL